MDMGVGDKPLDLSQDLQELVGLATGEAAERELLRRGLDW